MYRIIEFDGPDAAVVWLAATFGPPANDRARIWGTDADTDRCSDPEQPWPSFVNLEDVP